MNSQWQEAEKSYTGIFVVHFHQLQKQTLTDNVPPTNMLIILINDSQIQISIQFIHKHKSSVKTNEEIYEMFTTTKDFSSAVVYCQR